MNPSNPALYAAALAQLRVYSDGIRQHKGRLTQIFLGLKFYQGSLPNIHAGSFVSVELLQSMLDDLFAKSSRPPTACVVSVFTENHLARTGLAAPGQGPQNTWRNNFNLQKGVGCYAAPSELASHTFLDESRVQCRHLTPPAQLEGSRCGLCATGATYRRESHRKWLRIDPGGNGYAVVDLLNVSNFTPYVAPGGVRLPLLPVMVALYHDASPGLTLGQRATVDTGDFLSDFNFSAHEAATYFDDSPTNPHNAALLTRFAGDANFSAFAARVAPVPSMPVLASPPPIPPVLEPIGTQVPPPQTNSGWEAEQFVADALTAAGWTVHIVSRQQVGYDLYVSHSRTARRIEVKSSVGTCSPSLTAREWQQANYFGPDYVLAVLENFNPQSQNLIYWVPDPARRCSANAVQSVTHSISRLSWRAAAVSLAQI